MKKELYFVGGFTFPSWREEFSKKLSEKYIINDARNHEQFSIKRLLENDSIASKTSYNLAYKRKGKKLGTFSFGELGFGFGAGQPIITLDENKHQDAILKDISTAYFNSKEECFKFLNNKSKINSIYSKLEQNKNKKEEYQNIFFIGDTKGTENFLDEISKTKTVFVNNILDNLSQFSNKTDLVIANFNKGWEEEAVFGMGLANYLNIPLISIDGNWVAYPPLTGLSKLIFTGTNRFERAKEYVEFPPGNGLSTRTKIYLDAGKEFAKKVDFKIEDKTKKDCKNVYFSGDLENMDELIDSIKKTKNVQSKFNDKTDLVVVNFNDSGMHNEKGIKDMCVANKRKTPVLLLNGNEVLHKELAELSRRPLIGKHRFENAKKYLINLKSQHISQEALVYYDLMKNPAKDSIYFVTGNDNKYQELNSIIPNLKKINLDLPEIQSNDAKEIIKTKLTKASKLYPDLEFIVEDTSLYFDALNGFPGPLIKWFMEKQSLPEIYMMVDKLGNSNAQAKTIIGYFNKNKEINYFEGIVNGKIVEPLVSSKFGWDPLFLPEGYDKTFADMDKKEKNSISMRGIAGKNLKDFLDSE